MTRPTRVNVGALTVAEAMRRINDREMTEMCLAVNQLFGTPRANKLLDLFGAARRELADARKMGAAIAANRERDKA